MSDNDLSIVKNDLNVFLKDPIGFIVIIIINNNVVCLASQCSNEW